MPSASPTRVTIFGLSGVPEVRPGDDLARLALTACTENEVEPAHGDVFVFTQKIVSKSEGRVLSTADVEPSPIALGFAGAYGRDAKLVEVALREARRVVRMDRGVLITETHHGLVCANSGVDASNVGEEDCLCLLPEDPDRSARELRRSLEESTGRRVAVLVTDTFGRPWREGLTNVAIGVSGMDPFDDHRGLTDPLGRTLAMSVLAVADEIASAAELVMRKLDRIPIAVVRGYAFKPEAEGSAARLLRDPAQDLFR